MTDYEETEERITADEAAALAGLHLSVILTWCSTGQLATARCKGERNDEVWSMTLAELEEEGAPGPKRT